MPDFNCKVVTAEGVILERTMTADSVNAVYSILKQRKEQLISVKKKRFSLDLGKFFAQQKKVKPKEMSIFTNQLKVMLRSGIPIIKCLETLERQASSERFKEVVIDMHKSVIGGQSLSQAMGNHPNVFSNLYVHMVKAGEATGQIDNVLEQLEIFTEIEITTNAKVKSALRYPLIVLSVIAVAFYLAVTKIVPSFAGLFSGFGGELPALTLLLMSFSDFLVKYGMYLIGGLAASIYGIKAYIKTPSGAYQWDALKLKIPIMKGIIVTSSMARFSLIMKTLVVSGVQIIDALEIAKNTIGNLVYEKEIGEARQKIIGGVSISKALESEHIPDITVNMIAIGEESGSLTAMLGTVSDFFMSELKEKLETLTATMEPIITLVLGIFVAFFVATIFVPMFKMAGLANI